MNIKLTKLTLALIFLVLSLNFVHSLDNIYVFDKNSDFKEHSIQNEFNVEDYSAVYLNDNLPHDALLGEMQNVVIRKKGLGISVLFKENSVFERKLSNGEWQNYEKLKSKSELYFNENAELIGGDFEVKESSKHNLNKKEYSLPTDSKVEFDENKLSVKLNSAGEFGFDENNLKLKKDSKFNFDSDGKITNAEFSVSEKSNFKFKGYEVDLPKDSEVFIENNKIKIKLSNGKLKKPVAGENADKNIVFEFQSDNNFKLEGNEINSKSLFYDENGFYSNEDFTVNYNGNEDIFVKTNEKLYFVFNKENLVEGEDSIYLSDSEMILSSEGEGPKVLFKENNRMGFVVDDSHSISAQAIEGKMIFEKAESGKIPKIGINGKSKLTLDKRGIYSKGDRELYFNTKGDLMGFEHKEYDSLAEIYVMDKNYDNLKNFNFYSNGKDQYGSVVKGKFESPLEFFKTKKDFYVSSNVAFNQLTLEAQKFYDGMNEKEQKSLLINVKENTENSYSKGFDDEKTNVAFLQQILDQSIEEMRKKNPILASVRIRGGGGSGTIIGTDKEGYPIILTAGHLGGATRKGHKYTGSSAPETSQGLRIEAVSLGGYGDYGGSGWDIALLKGTQKIEDIAYIPVAGEDHDINRGIGLRIGCPKCGPFKQTKTRIGDIGNIIKHGFSDSIIGGESGGGLFNNGKLIGIVSTNGYYTGPNVIRKFLRDRGYDFLIRLILFLNN